jgi:homoserine kinase type II
VAQFTQLCEEDLGKVARRFALGPLRSVTPLVAGTVNTNLRVESERGLWFVRINEGKSEADVIYEGELSVALAAAGAPLPLPRAASDGRPFAAIALESHTAFVSCFPWVEGVHHVAPGLTAGDTRALGGALARLHRAGQGFTRRRTSHYDWPEIMARWDRIRTQVEPRAAADLDVEIAAIAALAPARAALPTGVIHGDLFPDNVLFDAAGGISALLDFEQASDGTLAYDLAVCLCSWCFDDTFAIPRMAALIDGYQGERPLEPSERSGLFVEARAAAARFTVTRLTDVALNPRAAEETKRTKDWRRFHARSRELRQMGEAGFAERLALR